MNEEAKKTWREKLLQDGEKVKQISDFSEWSNKDMSELFWLHASIYAKNPNEHSLRIMDRAWLWACHDNHGLANSFLNAIKWITGGRDFYDELEARGWQDKK